MKIASLSLDNWRGVKSRKVHFADGVTLIEGPNEIGKSTIVEAIHTLFDEMDSSLKKTVKAIQPVGEDVGSRVEAEVMTGDYHFIYSKTYNKDRKTELRILAPKPEQLTGREAHERAEQILEATVDRTLWNALLVEQGKEIAGAYLADSAGLARALDDAVGTSRGDQPDSALFNAVQSEYEQYFTLKTGKPRFAELEKELQSYREKVDSETAALAEVEADSNTYERTATEIARLENLLPGLQENFRQHEANWQKITRIRDQVIAKKRELDSAIELRESAVNEQQRRQTLINSIKTNQDQLKQHREVLAPQLERVRELKSASDKAAGVLKDLKQELNAARKRDELARSDEGHLNDVENLHSMENVLKKLQEFNRELNQARKVISAIKIDAGGLETLRRAEADLQLAVGKRDTVTSSFEIRAAKKLKVLLNDDEFELTEGEVEARDIASELRVDIPDVASILIVPSQSAGELEARVEECKQTLNGLLAKYGVQDLVDGIAVAARRANAERDRVWWMEKIDGLLDGQNEAELGTKFNDLQVRGENYLANRPVASPMPDGLEKAIALRKATEDAVRKCVEAVERQEQVYEELRDEHVDANASHLVAAQEISGLERVEEDGRKQLSGARSVESDEALGKRVEERSDTVAELQKIYNDLSDQLASVSPEATELLMSNAREASQRAERELGEERTRLAILQDRLTKARANGRFEAMEESRHGLNELEIRYTTTRERAAAASLLWETLTRYRDSARKVYVKPLKDGIEQLGKIVFGSDFAIELGDDWSLISRTQGGKTISFDDLSVGTKEQLGILTRLAAARIVSSQGGVPLILDDALGFSDPGRLETMGAAIATAGKESQVILLTCTPGRFTHVGSAEVVRL